MTTVVEMTWARGLNQGKGYGFRHVYAVLNGMRRNKEISALHQELVQLRTAAKAKRS